MLRTTRARAPTPRRAAAPRETAPTAPHRRKGTSAWEGLAAAIRPQIVRREMRATRAPINARPAARPGSLATVAAVTARTASPATATRCAARTGERVSLVAEERRPARPALALRH